jgi:hypothetical protein
MSQQVSKFSPRPHQQVQIEYMLGERRRFNVWAMMGMGKSAASLYTLHVARELLGDDAPTLVLAPKFVADTVWPDEAQKWEQFRGLEVSSITGAVKDRLAAVGRDVPIHAVNYQNIPWLVDYWGSRWPYRRVIADESTRLKSHRAKQGGVRTQALAKVAFKYVNEWINLTGTPSPNGLLDLWGQQWFIDKGERLGTSFSAFRDRWFKLDPYKHKYDPYRGAEEEIIHLLSDCTLSLRVEDWFDLDKPVVATVPVKLPPAARKLYNKMERELVASFAGRHIEAPVAMTKSMKCAQIASGAVLTNDEKTGKPTGEFVEVHDAKLQALEALLDELGGEPVIVSYYWQADLARLKRAFKHGTALADEKDSKRVIRDWNAGKIPLLFLHPQSAGHGLNLQLGGRALVFYSYGWGLEEHEQIIERIGPMRQRQAGLDRSVLLYYLTAEDTIEEDIKARLADKADLQTAVSTAMARAATRSG